MYPLASAAFLSLSSRTNSPQYFGNSPSGFIKFYWVVSFIYPYRFRQVLWTLPFPNNSLDFFTISFYSIFHSMKSKKNMWIIALLRYPTIANSTYLMPLFHSFYITCHCYCKNWLVHLYRVLCFRFCNWCIVDRLERLLLLHLLNRVNIWIHAEHIWKSLASIFLAKLNMARITL